MASDIVIPDKNEQEFIKMAEALGYSKLYLVDVPKEVIAKLQERTEIRLLSASIGKKKQNTDIFLVRTSEDDRHTLEKTDADILFDIGIQSRKDFMHQRASGFNQVLAAIAKKRNKSIGYSLSTLMSMDKHKRPLMLGRISQNIMLCRKYKVRMMFFSLAITPYAMRSPHDIQSVGISLGMHPKEAKDSLNF